MCGRKLKKEQCFQFGTCLNTHKKKEATREKKKDATTGHLRDCPIDQVNEWCLARRDATALLI